MTIKHPTRWAWLIGLGVSLFPIHNVWLTRLLTTQDGVAQAFLPAIGAAIWIMSSLSFCSENLDAVKDVFRTTDRKVVIPLLVIAGAIALSGLAQHGDGTFLNDLGAKMAPALTALALLSMFVSARLLGKQVFYPLAIGSVIASVGVIAHALIFPGQVTGGYVFENNYDIVIGYVILGTVLYVGEGRMWFASSSLIALFLTGSPEGVFSSIVLGVFLVAREVRDKQSVRTLVQLALPVLFVAALWFGVGYGQELYSYTTKVATGTPTVAAYDPSQITQNESLALLPPQTAVTYRFGVIEASLSHVEPLGSGLVLTEFKTGIVHNAPLILVQQLGYPGILGAVAWMWLCAWGLWKSPWKYGWLALISLGVWDHYVWSQMAPMIWLISGVSVGNWIKSDRILTQERQEPERA